LVFNSAETAHSKKQKATAKDGLITCYICRPWHDSNLRSGGKHLNQLNQLHDYTLNEVNMLHFGGTRADESWE
jgi:hypothetical protein